MTHARFRGLGPGSPVGRRILGDFGAPWILRLTADLVAVCVAFLAASWLHQMLVSVGLPADPLSPERVAVFVGVFGATLVAAFGGLGLYGPRASILNLWELATVLKGLGVSAALVVAAAYGFQVGAVPRSVVASGLLLSGLAILLVRRLVAAVLRHRQLKGVWGRRVLIAGAGSTGRLLMKRLIDAPHESRTVVGFLDDRAPIGSTVTCTTDQTTNSVIRRSVLGRLEDLVEVASVFGAAEVLVDEASVPPGEVPRLLEVCEGEGLSFGLVPKVGDVRADRLVLQYVGTMPILRPRGEGQRRAYRIASRALDVCVATISLAVTAPLWLVIGAIIKLDSRGPVLFTQERVGRKGEPFRMYKFRSMRHGTRPYASSPRGDRDGRITRVGRLLRMGGVDELPQLINVLRGDMALVGPRPEMAFIVDGYTPYERRRLEVKPGITGIWQISPDRHGEIHHNVEYDLYYIDHRSLLLDVLILFETVVRSLEMMAKALVRRALTPPPANDVYAMPSDFELRSPQEPPGPLIESGTLVLEHPDQWRAGYLLVAMDQRESRAGERERWEAVLVAAFAVSCRWPVKILAPESARSTVNDILEQARQRMGSGQARIAYVSARNEWEVRALISSAALLVSDAAEFLDWAAEIGVSSLTYPSGERRIVGGGVAARVIAELTRWLWKESPEERGTADLDDWAGWTRKGPAKVELIRANGEGREK